MIINTHEGWLCKNNNPEDKETYSWFSEEPELFYNMYWEVAGAHARKESIQIKDFKSKHKLKKLQKVKCSIKFMIEDD